VRHVAVSCDHHASDVPCAAAQYAADVAAHPCDGRANHRHAVSDLYRPVYGRSYREGCGGKLAEKVMGPAEIAGAVVFFITVSGTLWGIWWRIEGRVEKA